MFKRKNRMPALTKSQIIENIHKTFQDRHTKQKSAETVETLLEIIKKSLETGDDLLMSGFGKFCIKQKKARKGRNPATGEPLILDKRRVITFRCSGKLKDRLNKD